MVTNLVDHRRQKMVSSWQKRKLKQGLLFSRYEYLFLHTNLLKCDLNLDLEKRIKKKKGINLNNQEIYFVKEEFKVYQELKERLVDIEDRLNRVEEELELKSRISDNEQKTSSYKLKKWS